MRMRAAPGHVGAAPSLNRHFGPFRFEHVLGIPGRRNRLTPRFGVSANAEEEIP